MGLAPVFFRAARMRVPSHLFSAPYARVVSLLVALLCLGKFCCFMPPIRPALCRDKRHLSQPDELPDKQRCFAPEEF
jgi:hypothetical protein